jgi:hypothetical protein
MVSFSCCSLKIVQNATRNRSRKSRHVSAYGYFVKMLRAIYLL